ncbi:MAG TPA: hypothetical protein VF454_05065 [Gemmatimonadales bacterium]
MTAPKLPTLVVRFSALWPWMLLGTGVLFFILGVAIAATTTGGGKKAGELIALAALTAVFGGNYWRNHRHVVARLTPKELILRRDGTIPWSEIELIERTEIRMRYKGASGGSVYICIKLRSPRPAKNKLDAWGQKLKSAVTGYDVLLGGDEIDIPVERLIAECQARMAAPVTPALTSTS